MEAYVHLELDDHAIGREWFRLGPEVALTRDLLVIHAAKRMMREWGRHGVELGDETGTVLFRLSNFRYG